MKDTLRRRAPALLVSLVLAAVFCLFFARSNTPLGPCVGSDNAIYLTMGTALAQGYAPYTQIFDHKGPLLFLIETLPQLFCGGNSTLAVFVQEIVFLFVSLRLMAAVARHLGAGCTVPAQLAYLALLGPFLDGGNLNEEYAACLTLAGLYAALRTFDADVQDGPPRALLLPAGVMGAVTMLAFLLRANNALCLTGLTAGLALCLIARRQYARLGMCALGFLAGCAAAGLPVVLWLAANGALQASVYGAFIHNMMYAQTDGASRLAVLLNDPYGRYAMLLAGLACAGALAHALRTRRAMLPFSLMLSAACAGLSVFVSHKYYLHYLMMLVPVAAVGAAMLPGALFRTRRMRVGAGVLISLVCCAALAISGHAANETRRSELAAQGTFAEDARALYAQVLEDERGRFMAYRVEPKWYVYAGALPCMRFYFLQEILAEADPAVMDEIVATFESEPPLWLVIYYNRPFSPPYDARVAEIFERDYEFVDARGQYQLLRLREGA